MKMKHFYPVMVFCLVFVSHFACAQITTDNFDGTYAYTASTDFSGDAAPGWSAWTESAGWGSDNYLIESTLVSQSGQAQEIDMNSGSGGTYKSFSVAVGKYITISIWIKATNEAGTGNANSGSQWVEYGYDPGGGTVPSPDILWDDFPKFDFANNFNWKQYTMPALKIVQAEASSITVWLKGGSMSGGHYYFDDLTIEESDVPPGGPVVGDFPDDFEGTYVAGVAPDWYAVSLPGGTDINREEIAGVGGSGSAQRIMTEDADLGVVKLFNAPLYSQCMMELYIRTASAAGEVMDPGAGDIEVGVDPTGQYLSMAAETILWDGRPGQEPFVNQSHDDYALFSSGAFVVTEPVISVWLHVKGGFFTSGARGDFDDLDLIVLRTVSSADPSWELYP
jgi:hypothetical protein